MGGAVAREPCGYASVGKGHLVDCLVIWKGFAKIIKTLYKLRMSVKVSWLVPSKTHLQN